jgi:hypothetical protein
MTGQKLTWVMRLPRIDPPLGAGDPCMMRPLSWPARLFRQALPRRQRSCCYYHSMDMRAAARTVVRIHRILSQSAAGAEPGTDGEAADDLRHELLAASGLTADERRTAMLLLDEDCGIIVWREEGERRWTYQEGRHRARALMDAGARRIVVTREDDRDYDG